MDKPTISLDDLRIASPCPARWEEMMGSESTRYCDSCRHNVYDISAMTRAEAEMLLSQREARTCIRYYRRADGTIMTADCPVGARTIRQRLMNRVRTFSAALLALLAGGTLSGGADGGHRRPTLGGLVESPPPDTASDTPPPFDTLDHESEKGTYTTDIMRIDPDHDTTRSTSRSIDSLRRIDSSRREVIAIPTAADTGVPSAGECRKSPDIR